MCVPLKVAGHNLPEIPGRTNSMITEHLWVARYDLVGICLCGISVCPVATSFSVETVVVACLPHKDYYLVGVLPPLYTAVRGPLNAGIEYRACKLRVNTNYPHDTGFRPARKQLFKPAVDMKVITCVPDLLGS